MNGKYMKTLIKDGLVSPRALALDLEDKWLYYTDWNRERPVIGRIRLDGSDRQDYITENINTPNGLVRWCAGGSQRRHRLRYCKK